MPRDYKESVNLHLSIGITLAVSIIIELQEHTEQISDPQKITAILTFVAK